MALHEREKSIEKVVQYLEELGLHNLIPTFIKEKFDETTIINADDAVLKRHGLEADGDIIRLRILCQQGDTNTRKVHLKQTIAEGSKTRMAAGQSFEKSPPKEKTRAVYISWKVFDKKLDRYVQIKRKRGGGSVKFDFSLSAGKDEVLSEAIKHFWKLKVAKVADGAKEDYFFHLVDERDQPIPDVLAYPNDSEVPFTVLSYVKLFKLPRPKIILLTKEKSNQQKILSHPSFIDSDEGEQIDLDTLTTSPVHQSTPRQVNPSEHLTPVSTPTPTSRQINSIPDFTPENSPTQTAAPRQTNPNGGMLIGSSEERDALRMQIDKAVLESMIADRQRDVERQREMEHQRENEITLQREQAAEIEKQAKINQIMEKRRSLVKPEADLQDDHVIVRVRHPTIGNITRMFFHNQTMMDVYFWVGSLTNDPLFFQLTDCDNVIRFPDEKINQGVYNMASRSDNINMSRDGDIMFKDFASAFNNEDIIQISAAEEPNSSVVTNSSLVPNSSLVTNPSVVTNSSVVPNLIGDSSFFSAPNLAGDPNLLNNLNDVEAPPNYQRLEQLRLLEEMKLSREEMFIVNRDNIFQDFLAAYQSFDDTAVYKFKFCFKGEDAVGDGVTREAYTCFFEQLYENCDGNQECVPTHSFTVNDLNVIGIIITHGFVTYQVFPVKLCKASLKHQLFGNVSSEDLGSSFHRFVLTAESDLLKKIENGVVTETQAILNVFSDAGVFTLPTKQNIKELVLKVSNVLLIRSCTYEMNVISTGMGEFWKNAGPDCLDALYKCTIPTAENIIEALHPEEKIRSDQQLTTYLHRFIRSCDFDDLLGLTRFVTGSHSVYPGLQISVKFVDPSSDQLPRSKMCFNILYLPRGYTSMRQFRNRFFAAIRHEEFFEVTDGIEFEGDL